MYITYSSLKFSVFCQSFSTSNQKVFWDVKGKIIKLKALYDLFGFTEFHLFHNYEDSSVYQRMLSGDKTVSVETQNLMFLSSYWVSLINLNNIFIPYS